MGIYDSIIKDAPNSAIDFNEMKKSKLQSQQKSNRELSAGGQNTTAATTTGAKSRITFSVYDSINL